MGLNYQGVHHNQAVQSKIKQSQHTSTPHRTQLTGKVEDLASGNQIETAYGQKKKRTGNAKISK